MGNIGPERRRIEALPVVEPREQPAEPRELPAAPREQPAGPAAPAPPLEPAPSR